MLASLCFCIGSLVGFGAKSTKFRAVAALAILAAATVMGFAAGDARAQQVDECARTGGICQSKYTCRTSEVEARIKELQARVRVYEKLYAEQLYAVHNYYFGEYEAGKRLADLGEKLERYRNELHQLETLPPCPVQPTEQVAGAFSNGAYTGVGFGALATVCPTWTTTGIDSFGSSDPVGAENQACHSSGFLTSAYVGYQWTLGSRWLAGIETDLGYATNSATTGVPGVSSAPGDNVNVKEDWDGGVLGRLGYAAAPRTIVYATTGIAFQHLQATVTCTGTSPNPCGRFGAVAPMTATNAPTLTGWTLGGGAQYALTGNLHLRAEYRYSDYGTYNATYGNPANVAVSSGIRLRTNTATVGLTYAFGGTSASPPTSPPPLITK